VSDATPLSRLLIEVAREGCDIDTAEGRALLASQAKPMWLALPDGVLKTQLLGELAELVGIGSRELQNLWQGNSPTSNTRTHTGVKNTTSTWTANATKKTARPLPMRRKAPTRQDRALQILFTDMPQWAALALPQQHMLMDLPPPHGRLFTWLDQQWQEHGVQPLAALREGLREHEDEATLVQLLGSAPSEMDNDASELQSIMRELEKAHVASQIDELTRRMASDPAAYAQIKVLTGRLASLKKPATTGPA